jgi:hypothetical protein
MKKKIELEPNEAFDYLAKILNIQILERDSFGGHYKGKLTNKSKLNCVQQFLQKDTILSKHSNKNAEFLIGVEYRWIDFWINDSLFTLYYYGDHKSNKS